MLAGHVRDKGRTSKLNILRFAVWLTTVSVALGQEADRLFGIWTLDEGFQTVELLFRSDGRYEMDTKSSDPALGFAFRDPGRYQVDGETLTLTPDDFFGEPEHKRYRFELIGSSLSLTSPNSDLTDVYQFKPGSREDVLAREKAEPDLVGTWVRKIEFAGTAEYTFRPGGYYILKNTPEGNQFPPEYIRGRYVQDGTRLRLTPYSGVEASFEIDFFGTSLTLIDNDGISGHANAYEKLPGSGAEVRAKAAQAAAFLSDENWHVGVWEMHDEVNAVDLTIRPEGHYSATNATEILRGMVRGRYTLESSRIHFFPFVGQGLYSRDNGDFGKVERTRVLDYYDGELQLIDLEAISQSVAIARKRPGSQASLLEQARQGQVERERAGWQVGVWQVNDPNGWMEFTFRPDNRYIAKSGTAGVPSQVERGQYVLGTEKMSLAPYPGLGEARGFEVDFFDGDLFLIGDLNRMIVARKIPESESVVIEKTRNPEAMKGERGSILGLWTANMPGQSAELVFRPDGEFRLSRCQNNVTSHDYGLYSVNMAARTLVYDSRFVPVQTRGLDFYGDTLTLYGGFGPPSTYTVNLGMVDASIAASLAADAEQERIDDQWLNRVPVGPRDPGAVQIPTADIPADPNPGRVFSAPTVFTNFQLFRRLTPGFVYFNEQGSIKSVAVVNTSEWAFFPTGRVLVRFKNYHAGLFYPNTTVEVTASWGAYEIEPQPGERDILHRYADNAVFIKTDTGEQEELTLENGRRYLFLDKDYQTLSEWAAEQKPVPCQVPEQSDGSLANTGISLSTNIKPDEIEDSPPLVFKLTGPSAGGFAITGRTTVPGGLVTERAISLSAPVFWQPIQTNHVAAGPFTFDMGQGTHPAAFFRIRTE